MIWIGYTTLYREGGAKFKRAAETLEREKRADHPSALVRCQAVESKRDFVQAMERIRAEGEQLDELHFLGHSGMYGPMFRTTSMPEQFSPHEWRTLPLPFAEGAQAFFHACRTARFFAPFFARTYGVTAHGFFNYTTVSTRRDRFSWESPLHRSDRPLYLIACPGRKSHGLLGSVAKYGRLARAETMKPFAPAPPEGDATYGAVAALYDRAFADIAVRADEWRWLSAHLPAGQPRALDIGCGNGALLTKLAPRLSSGTGVDSSPEMIALARARGGNAPKLSFSVIDGPRLPFPDRSFDVVTSLLSFRYLDWDPLMNEVRRVLAPGGRLLIVDMVTVPLKAREGLAFARSKGAQVLRHLRRPKFARALKALVSDPHWATMLRYNPIRAEHEYRWYLQSRFPKGKLEVLTVAWQSRVLAFDTGPLEPGWVPPQSYP